MWENTGSLTDDLGIKWVNALMPAAIVWLFNDKFWWLLRCAFEILSSTYFFQLIGVARVSVSYERGHRQGSTKQVEEEAEAITIAAQSTQWRRYGGANKSRILV